MDSCARTWLGSRLLAAACAYALVACSEAPSVAPSDAAARDASRDGGDNVGDRFDAGGRLDGSGRRVRVALFSRTTGYRHDSIELGREALREQLPAAEFQLQATEQGAELIEWLPRSDVLLFLSTTGDVLNADQQARVEAFVRGGGGFVGVHAAGDCEYDWPFYGELIGAWFDSHPAIQPARVIVEAGQHPAVAGLPTDWQREDEWYNFRTNPRDRVTVLLRLDESSYTGGTMGEDHPIAWSRTLDRGRTLYTALGHTDPSWGEPHFLNHIENALRWAAGGD
jgi:type 1 glutamine amidotransferase